MKVLKTIQLLDPAHNAPFHNTEINDSAVAGTAGSGWSVRSYTLHGGLQEGVQVVEVNNGRLSFAILPTRGMGIWKGQCGKVRLAWDSPVKRPVNPAFINLQERGGIGWLKGFNEWFVRCGINSMGAPGIDTVLDYSSNEFEVPLTLHGNIANCPAHAVSVEITESAIVVRGEVDEAMMFGPSLRLTTEICTEFGSGAMVITDTVCNLGDNPVEHQMLYHINYGATLLEEGAQMRAPYVRVAPRDPRAAEGIATHGDYGPSQVGFAEQAYFYQLQGAPETGETVAMLRNAAGDQASVLRYTLADFPAFTLWKNTAGQADGYVTGLEPATCYPNTRRFERSKGRVISLAAGEARTTRICIEALDCPDGVAAVEAEIAQLQASVSPTVHPQPIADFSDV